MIVHYLQSRVSGNTDHWLGTHLLGAWGRAKGPKYWVLRTSGGAGKKVQAGKWQKFVENHSLRERACFSPDNAQFSRKCHDHKTTNTVDPYVHILTVKITDNGAFVACTHRHGIQAYSCAWQT